MYEIVVLISGKGSTLDNLAFHCYDECEGMLHGMIKIKKVIADRVCDGLTIADKWNIAHAVCPKKQYASQEEWATELFSDDVDLHVMAGFLSHVVVPKRCEGKIVNIHPSLLPAYGGKGMYGLKVHEEVIKKHENVTGVTVHTVTSTYDDGMILGQMKVAVLERDTPESLQYAVQSMERKLYPRTILNYLNYLRKLNAEEAK